MPGIFKSKFNYTGTGPCDLSESLAPSGNHIIFLGFTIYQTGTAEFGDAHEQGAELTLETGNTTAGTGGSAVTPEPLATDGAAANYTSLHQATTAATAGTVKEKGRWGWNPRIEKEKMLAENEQIKVASGTRAVLRLKSTLSASFTIRGEAIWQEF